MIKSVLFLSLFLILIWFTIYPSVYANVIGPDGISTCQRMQMDIDEGAKSWYLVSMILENMNNSKDGQIEIIDSDCYYTITPTNYFDDTWHAIIEDGSEKKEFDFIINDGKISNDEFGIKGLVFQNDRIVLEFTELEENVCFGYAEFIHTFDGTIFLTGDVDCFDGITRTIESDKVVDLENIQTTDAFDGIYDITFVTPLIDGEVEKYVILGEIKIENGIISSPERTDQNQYSSMTSSYKGFVDDDGVFLIGPCINKAEGYYYELQFVDDRFVGNVECESSFPISEAKVILIPTGQDFPGFTKMSLLDTADDSTNGGGCLIATAAYGTELAPQVQLLREIRDNQLLNTESGTAFMSSFNQFYYSFSPVIADLERENSLFKEMVKIVITPMVSSLSILNYIDMDSEVEVLSYGISLILLNVGMYFVFPVIVIIGCRKL